MYTYIYVYMHVCMCTSCINVYFVIIRKYCWASTYLWHRLRTHTPHSNTTHTQTKLDDAAGAEKRLLMKSEEIVDGGCKDHHAESCGGESCCTFWAKAGQCLAASAHQEWMSLRCSRSCGSCSAAPALPAQVQLVPPAKAASPAVRSQHKSHVPPSARNHVSNAVALAARAAKKRLALKNKLARERTGLSWPPAGGTKRVNVSMVLRGLDTSNLSYSQLEQALHRAVAALSPDGLQQQAVQLDSVQAIHGKATLLPFADKPIRRRRWAHPKRSRTVAFVHGTMTAPTTEENIVPDSRQSRGREEDREDSFAPRRRLLSIESLVEEDLDETAVRVKFHVDVPVGLKGQRMVQALRAALREEVHKTLVHHKMAHKSSLHVALEHVHGTKEVVGTLHTRFGSVLGARPFHDDIIASNVIAGEHRSAEESGLGAAFEHNTPNRDNFGSVLAGGTGDTTPGAADSRKLADSAEAKAPFARWFAHSSASSDKDSASGEVETGLGQAGLGDSGPDRVFPERPAPGPLFGSPYMNGKKPVAQEPVHDFAAGTQPELTKQPAAPTTKEIAWSFEQKLQDPPMQPMPLGGDEDMDPASVVGWSYDSIGRSAQPALPSACDADCISKREGGRAVADKVAREHQVAEDKVAVKKEHVIEDARNLKHLMTAITEEKDLLEGIPAPPPIHVEPHWGFQQDKSAVGLPQDSTSTSTLSAAADANAQPVSEEQGKDAAQSEQMAAAASSNSHSIQSVGTRGRVWQRREYAPTHSSTLREVREQRRTWHTRQSVHSHNRIAGAPRQARSKHILRERLHTPSLPGAVAHVATVQLGNGLVDAWGSAVPAGGGGVEGDFESEKQKRGQIEADERLAAEERKQLYAATIKVCVGVCGTVV